LSSTYIKWILVAIAVAVGVRVVARPTGKNKPGASGTNAAPAPPEEQPAAEAEPAEPPPPAPVRSAPQPVPRVPQPQAQPQTYVGSASPSAGTASPVAGDEPVASALGLWGDGYADGVRDRWRELQLRFVDDPQSVAGEAERVVDEAVAALTASVNARKQELSTWRAGGGGDDTEQLRAAVARYREFLDRLLRV
jgi:hypothetical protein